MEPTGRRERREGGSDKKKRSREIESREKEKGRDRGGKKWRDRKTGNRGRQKAGTSKLQNKTDQSCVPWTVRRAAEESGPGSGNQRALNTG